MLSTQTATITAAAIADLPARPGEVARDRLQVVRHRDRRQGDHDQVVDQDRPAGDEGDQLVEGVAGEGRGAAALAEHRPALDVGERGQAEEQAGGEEDQRRQPEAAVGDDAEREVDREADRRVGGGEQRRDAEAALRSGSGAAAPARPARGAVAPCVPALRRSPLHPRADPEPADADREEGDAPSGSRARAGRRRWRG